MVLISPPSRHNPRPLYGPISLRPPKWLLETGRGWRISRVTLRQYLADRLVPMCNGDWTAGTIQDRHLGVDAQALVDGGADVGWTHGAILDVSSVCVAGP